MHNHHRIAFVAPFLGDLPQYTPLFLQSVANNTCVDLLLFVDREPTIKVPDNVYIQLTDRPSLLDRIRSSTGLEIPEITGHKLCDFRPLYSSIFWDELKSYQWWGHCDIDLMFGDLSSWLDQRLTPEFDAITASPNSTVGHFTIYKNDQTVTSEMRAMVDNPTYRQILLQPDSNLLDEWGAYHHILSRRKLRILTTPPLQEAITLSPVPLGITFEPNGSIADICPSEFGIAYWKDGRTWYESARREPVEVLYIHFMGNKAWWHWLFLRPSSISRRFHMFSPIGYGLISGRQGMASIQYKFVRSLQALLEFAKVQAGKSLRKLVDPSFFRKIRRLVTPSGRYR